MKFFSTYNIIKSILLTVILAVSGSSSLVAQGWEIYFGGVDLPLNYDDFGQSIISLDDEGYILVGTSASFTENHSNAVYVVRMDVDGNEIWSRNYEQGFNDFGFKIKETSNKNFIIAGATTSSPGSDFDALMFEIDRDGNLLWSNQFGFEGNEFFYDVAEADDGGYVFVGRIENTTEGHNDFLVLKTDEIGNTDWVQILGGDGNDEANGIVKTDTGYVVVGHDEEDSNEDIYLVSLAPNGDILWEERYDFSEADFAFDIIETSDNHFAIAGQQNNSFVSSQAFVLKVNNTDGALSWLRTFGDGFSNKMVGLQEAEDGGIVAVGETEIDAIDQDFLLIKHSSSGDVVWTREIGREGTADFATDISNSRNGGFILIGYNSLDLLGLHDVTVIHTDSEGLILSNHIEGRVYFDENGNCSDELETGLDEWLIIAESEANTYYGTTNANGEYSILVDTGTYDLRILTKNNYWEPCIEVYNNLEFNTFYDTTGLDFPIHATVNCPLLNVDVSAPSAQICTDITYTVSYCNDGTLEAVNPYVQIILDEDLAFNSASIAPATISGDTLVFNLENIAIGQCDNFTISVASDCASVPLSTYSVSAHIYPDDICTPISPDWDMSDIRVTGVCEGEEVEFTILNDSDNEMETPLEFIVFEDLIIQMVEPFDLGGNQDTTITIPATSSTYRLIAEQSEGHPGNSYPTVVVEGCLDGSGIEPTTGAVTVFQEDENNFFQAFDVQETGNLAELRAFPKGYPSDTGDSLLLPSNINIEYHFHFQNTTEDTVRRLVIRDTLPAAALEIASFDAGASSHPYMAEIYEGGIAKFIFEDINLPSMNEDEVNSQGFVRFKISQKEDLATGTIIKNSAAIYMGYEAPRMTNTVVQYIGGEDYVDFAVIDLINSSVEIFVPNVNISAFPNPFVEGLTIEIEGNDYKKLQVKLYDESGRLVMQEGFNGNQVHLQRGNLPSGILFFSIEAEGQLVTTGKVVVE